MRKPRRLNTVRVLPTRIGVGLGVGLVAAVGLALRVGDGVDGAEPQAATSAAITAIRPALLRRRARAGMRPLTR